MSAPETTTRKSQPIPNCDPVHWFVRGQVWEKSGGKCAYCGVDIHPLDHVIPRHMGGSNAIDNLVGTCQNCNLSKGGKTKEAFARGKQDKIRVVQSAVQSTQVLSEIETEDKWAGRIYLRPKEVAQLTGISVQEVYKSIYAGQLRALRYKSRVWLVPVEGVGRWVQEMSIETFPGRAEEGMPS